MTSQITYSIPYALLSTTELKNVNTIIRKTYTQAIGLPASTSTERLLKLGIHNTAEELIDGHLSSQTFRLGAKKAGRAFLSRLGLSVSL